MEGGGHLLALKVMRVSRPSLPGQWKPSADSPSHFDVHNANSVTSMDQRMPEKSQTPSTVRDFSALSQLLSLPSTFGSISLGETFTSCLCVTNSTRYEIEGVYIRVEMQSAATKSVVLELGGPEYRLAPSASLEGVVSSEIKELGQHTLSCIVHYRVPAGLRPPAPSDDPSDPRAQLFRKHYRFPVTNPFSVKTKVHLPKSPTALLCRSERAKVFLEVHIQNLTQSPMWFERLDFRPVDGWTSTEQNTFNDTGVLIDRNPIYGPGAMVQPQDTFQYVYTLIPSTIPRFPMKEVPGSVIPLGRLDVAWRTTFGEPGRLLTSMLSRKVPLPVVQPAPSALPPHVQRAISYTPRPQSPSVAPSSPSSSSRPSSPVPYKSRQPNRPQTPVQASNPPATALLPTDIEVDLVVDQLQTESNIAIYRPFVIHLTASVAAFVPPNRNRILVLAVQHIVYSRNPSSRADMSPGGKRIVHQSQGSVGTHSPSPSVPSTPRVLSADIHQTLAESPRKHQRKRQQLSHIHISLPSPHVDRSSPSAPKPIGTGEVEFLGSSLVRLAPFVLTAECEAIGPEQNAGSGTNPPHDPKRFQSRQLEVEYFPTRVGHANVGGLRLLLLSDKEEEMDGSKKGDDPLGNSNRSVSVQENMSWKTRRDTPVARNLQEWPTLAEIYVAPST
ncbi:hypothetical protein FS842_003990 [Serendipita sp. 407]|nr:hypothetical protein FS842_003990 [Serendipita sp. 407]